jgi:hypothetical protein
MEYAHPNLHFSHSSDDAGLKTRTERFLTSQDAQHHPNNAWVLFSGKKALIIPLASSRYDWV